MGKHSREPRSRWRARSSSFTWVCDCCWTPLRISHYFVLLSVFIKISFNVNIDYLCMCTHVFLVHFPPISFYRCVYFLSMSLLTFPHDFFSTTISFLMYSYNFTPAFSILPEYHTFPIPFSWSRTSLGFRSISFIISLLLVDKALCATFSHLAERWKIWWSISPLSYTIFDW